MEQTNRQFLLKERPSGLVRRDNFEFVDKPVPKPGANQALVRNLYLSIDPTNRIWMSDAPGYLPPVQIGEVVRGGGIGEVVSSQCSRYKPGDIVTGLIG